MEVTGTVVRVGETQQVSDRFRKRELVLTFADDGYEQFVSLEFVQDRVEVLDDVESGQIVTCHFDLCGRKWVAPDGKVKYFNTLKGWRIDRPTVDLTERREVPQTESLETEADAEGAVQDEIPF